MKASVDLLVTDAAEVVTVDGGGDNPLAGRAQDQAGVRAGAALAIAGGRIVAVAPQADLLARFDAPATLSARGGTVLPGLVDAHTHPVFDGTREAEFDMRARGAGYQQITAAGGGIFSSVRGLRAASRERLASLLAGRLDRFLAAGTTTLEARSGYGLSYEHELLSLELLAEADAGHPVDIAATCLAAHQMAPEFKHDRDGYITEICERILPEVARRGLATSADVFCDEGAFSVDESRRVLEAARACGLRLRVHADELAPVGAAELAAACGADTADHLVKISDAGMAAMLAAGTMPVLLPATCFSLRLDHTAPARRMLESGLPVALATDFNPGTSYTFSMVDVISLACGLLGLTVAEAVVAATRNAAASLALPGVRGRLAPGALADLVVLDVPNHLFLGYQVGGVRVRAVVKGGRLVAEDGRCV